MKKKIKLQAGGHVSKMGYRDDSPYRSAPKLDIHTPTGQIDMSATGLPLMANGRYLPPYSGMHQFEPGIVTEIPVAWAGQSIGKSQTGGGGGLQNGGIVASQRGTGDIQRPEPYFFSTSNNQPMRKAQNGTGLSGPVMRSGPNTKNSAPPNPTVTKAPSRGSFVNSTFPMQKGGHVGYNWQTPMWGWAQNGVAVDPSQQQMQGPMPPQMQGPQPQQQDLQEQQMMQVMDEIDNALQQGSSPKDVVKTLVKEGIPKAEAEQLVKQVLAHSRQGAAGGQEPPAQEQQEPQQEMPQQEMQEGMPQARRGLRMAQTGIGNATPQLQHPLDLTGGVGGIQPGQAQPSNTNITTPITQQQPFFSTGNFYADRATYTGQRAGDLRRQAGVDAASTDPATQKLATQERKAAGGNELVSVTSGAQAGLQGLENTVGIVGRVFGDAQARQLEEGQAYYNNMKNRFQTTPIQGTNTAPAFSQDGYVVPYGKEFGYGGRLPIYQAGGIPTEGTDFDSQNPNVMTERGETITDPNQGPMGPGGAPTGVVVNDQTGDNHSDPSGGNPYNLGPDAVVHSKVLGIKVGDFLEAIKGQPQAAYIAAKITEKYPNADKEVSYAKLAALFETKKLAQEVERIGKKVKKMEEEDLGHQSTKVTQKTNELNKKTLDSQLKMKTQEMADNSNIAGATGPIHGVAESLKGTGAYGGDIQQEHQQTAMGNPPTTASKGIKMKGKKMLLPTAQNGLVFAQTVGKPVPEGTFKMFTSPSLAKDTEDVYRGGQWLIPKTSFAFGPGLQDFNNAQYAEHPEDFTSPAAQNLVASVAPVAKPTPATKVTMQDRRFARKDARFDKSTGRYAHPLPENTPTNVHVVAPDDATYSSSVAATQAGQAPYDPNTDPAGAVLPVTGGTTTAPVKSPYTFTGPVGPSSIPGTNYSPEDVTNVYKNFYTNPDTPTQEQLNKGLLAGFNGQPLVDHPEQFMQLAAHTGFTGDWKSPTINKDIQNHLVDMGLSNPKYKDALKSVYERFLETHQGLTRKGETSSAPWSTLSDQDIRDWLADDKNGVRTTAAALALQPDRTPAPAGDPGTGATVAKIADAKVNSGPLMKKRLFQEGLNPEQIAGDLGELFMRRDAPPYIENQGYKRGEQDLTNQQFVNDWAARNAIDRSSRAITQYQPQNTPWITGQTAANRWTAQNELASKTAEQNAGIQKRYEDQRVALQEGAGKAKADALDTLAKRTADVRWKQSALTLNAINDIASKRLKQGLEKRKGIVDQTAFRNAAYDPNTGAYIGNTSGYTPTVGGPDFETLLLSEGYTPLDVYRIQHGLELSTKAQKEAAQTTAIAEPKKGQFGTRVKRVPASMKKRK